MVKSATYGEMLTYGEMFWLAVQYRSGPVSEGLLIFVW